MLLKKNNAPGTNVYFYIKLTEKGRNIARLPFLAEQRMVDIIVSVLDDEEIDTFFKKK